MGRTIPSFRIVLSMEKEDWKPFRNALDKSDRKKFDEMFELPKFYISACSNSVQYVRLHPILMSILLYHYKQLNACISEVERIEARVNSKREKCLLLWVVILLRTTKISNKNSLSPCSHRPFPLTAYSFNSSSVWGQGIK
jgi:hypothetical protein